MAVIIDYDAGNLRSVQRACAEVGLVAEISNDPARVRDAERIIFPGVGAAGAAMRSLTANGLDESLKDVIASGRPVLGICLGCQISFDYSEENDTNTLGILSGKVVRFDFDKPELKVPHMGWNEVRPVKAHPLLAGIETGDEFYFVHGYYPEPADERDVYAISDYEHDFACAVGRGNYFATQFHPEKSGRVGLRLLRAFSAWDGRL
ncbi:MAG: imidazole glycerol phosphate synthase subunit HisH [Pseudomonadales bacterium]|jgi:glutamine amidotransferase|nr:imidazole glycerol phosphate synthase subunit HisH [Pseudomonadales bacterium]MDP6471611.1 imidazole glycerol phosphate synthase subunit HisH [Pseudomonadales bacterium]MDP6828874.1 imidazole glycerol phosphate synthase subunit HisH [Pseudomonadales bacterium]MDP6970594.1 imidazole glycerol phosphate synthase subunit HisH [Pseudomonadales bacterium]|tara:strand:+ start:2837 stop:3454 length:618 start_codon:yes stop_codon:yes gene_type:complete